MAEPRVEQLLRQGQLMAEIDVSRVSNEELCKANEELHNNLQQLVERFAREGSLIAQLRARLNHFRRRLWTLSY